MYDNGFARAQRSYEAMEPPNSDDEWEAYCAKYETAENDSELEDQLFTAITNMWTERERNDVRLAMRLRTVIQKGCEHLDIEGKEKLYSLYDIAPSFDKFLANRQDDYPEPNVHGE